MSRLEVGEHAALVFCERNATVQSPAAAQTANKMHRFSGARQRLAALAYGLGGRLWPGADG